jgi:hypothetical protein
MRRISNLKELNAEKLRLKSELFIAEEKLKEDLHWIREELNPVKAIGKLFGNAFINKNDGILNDGVRNTIDVILKNIVLSRSGWITRLVVPFIIKNISSNYLAENKPAVLKGVRNLIRLIRKSMNRKTDFFDKSTVDEMDY